MQRVHLLRVDAAAEVFTPLWAAARQGGVRLGWLDLEAGATAPPAPLLQAAAAGALRAVAVGEGVTTAVKALRGEPVLRDLLREHFVGCAAVLVRGEVAAPALTAAGDERWTVAGADWSRRLSSAELLAALRRPRPWPAGH
ncbi:MAG TPA: hypothetical protein VMT16_05075 [Thermoanaerobaculia bacterium]|nr:hypothetical protein [Thermoanaerobaculia bacterium]